MKSHSTYLPIIGALLSLFAIAPSPLEAGTGTKSNKAVPLPVFTDVTAAAGLDPMVYPFGNPIWGDFDNDGDLDLFVDNHYNAPPYFYRNNGDGTFTNIFLSTTIRFSGDRHGSAWIDLAHDGMLDLHVTIGANKGIALGTKEDEFLFNNGDGTFSEGGEATGLTNSEGRGRSIAWADYNNDGFPDVLLGNLQTQMVLYKNNGDGTFTDVSDQAGLTGYQYVEVAWADYNNDGYPDVFCTDALFPFQPSQDKLLRNNGDGTFTDVTAQAGIQALTYGRSIAWGDYNNDGYLDLFISRGSTEGLKQTLYKNNGDGTFTDVTDAAGLGAIADNRAAAWGDFDNDGYLDLYVVASGSDPEGKGPNYLYHNNRNGTFTDVATTVGVGAVALSRGRGAAWADYNGDGFLDLLVTNGEDTSIYQEGPQILYRNGGNAYHWLKVKLIGTTSNRQGLGAKVTITVGKAIQYREMNGSMGHYLSQGATPLHFGVGKATIINKVVVKWPSGVVQTMIKVPADQELTVVETQ